MKEFVGKNSILKSIYGLSIIVLLFASVVTTFSSPLTLGLGYLIILGAFLIIGETKKYINNQKKSSYKYFKAWFFSSVQIGICFLLHQNIQPVFDSNTYFYAADSIISSRNLFAYAETVRGVVLPLICSVTKHAFYPILHKEILSYGVFVSVIFGLCFAVILPKILEKIAGTEFPLEFLFVFPTTICVFWWGLIVYPLSDCWAFCFLTFSIFSVLKVLGISKKENEKDGFIEKLLVAFWGAGAAYAAYNVRTVYLYSIGMLAVVFLIKLLITRDKKLIFGVILASIMGFLLVAAPQMAINQQVYGYCTPEIFGVKSFSNGMSLSVWQCKVGVSVQRYDTYIGDLQEFPQASMYFMDPSGQQFTDDVNFQQIATLTDYLKFIVKNPQQMSALLLRHLLNMMNNCYPETYVLDITRSRIPENIAVIMFWYTGLLALIWKLKGKVTSALSDKNKRKWPFGDWLKTTGIWIIIWLIPSLIIIPGAVEVRFLFPVYMVLNLFVLGEMVKKDFIIWIKDNWLISGLGALLFGGVLNSIWTTTMALLARA